MREYKKDLKDLKIKNLIQKSPNKPFGYYLLGQVCLYEKKYKEAQDSFKKSLLVDEGYIRSVIGLINVYIVLGKHLKAVKLFEKYKEKILEKNVFLNELCTSISTYDYSDIKVDSIIKKIKRGYESNVISKLYNAYNDNSVALILLSMYVILDNKIKGKNDILYSCVKFKYITDEFRWDCLKKISETNKSIYNDDELLRDFYAVPKNCDDNDFMNEILNNQLSIGDIKKASKSFQIIKDLSKITSSNLWKYINEKNIANKLDKGILECCVILIQRGWIDKTVVNVFNKLKDENVQYREKEILKALGY